MQDNKLFRYETEVRIIQSSIKKLNPQFSLCDVLVCYHGDNRNRTSIQKKVIEENLYSIYGVPIIGEWIYKVDDANEKTWGSHGGRIVIDDNGIHFEQTTRPFGFVSKEAADNASWVTVTEKDGHTQHEYLKLSGCILWTERYEEAKTILDDNYGQSMEIEIEKGHYKDDYIFDVDKFVFSALCILGTDVMPCFESACIGRHYELDGFKQEYTQMLDEYKNYQNNDESKGELKMNFAKIVEVLSSVTFKNSADEDVAKYRLLSATDSKVFALDMESYTACGFNYAITTEEDAEKLVIDFDSKTDMSLSAVDKIEDEAFVEFNIQDEINLALDARVADQTAILEAEFNSKMDEMRESYDTLAASYHVAMNKLEAFEAKEEAEKAAKHEADVAALFEKYAEKLSKCAEFLVYKAKVKAEEVTLDEVNEKLTLMAGKFMMDSHTKKNFSYTPAEAGLSSKAETEKDNRYGHLLDKYIK